MARGDQVYAYRNVMGVPYEHHGIDCGDGTIIHYGKLGEAAITRTSRETFARGGPIYIKSQPTAYIPQVVVERAESRLGEKQYDLFFNNCEHFANWCKTGCNECLQLSNFGLRFDQIKRPQIDELARQAAQTGTPEKTMRLFKTALENIALATRTLLPKYEQSMQDALTWHQVAQKALRQNREDLARAALHRKVTARKAAVEIKDQLTQLSDLQLNMEQNQAFVQNRLI